MTTLILDTFTSGSDVTIASHTPDAGVGTWGAQTSFTVEAATGQLKNTATTQKGSVYSFGSTYGGNGLYAEMQVKTGGTGTGYSAQMQISGSGGGNYGYVTKILGDGTLQLFRLDAGVSTQLGSTYTISGFSASTIYTVKCRVLNGVVTVYLNGTAVITVNDSTYTSSVSLIVYITNSVASTTRITQLESYAYNAIAESISVADAVDVTSSAAPIIAETIAASETIAAASIADTGISEAVTAADALTGGLAGSTAVSDVLSISDAPSASIMNNVSVSESIVFTNTITGSAIATPPTSRRSCHLTKWDSITGKRIPATGLVPLYYLFRPSDGKTLDLLDGMFKDIASCYLPKDAMSERDAANYPGWYDYSLRSGTFNLNEIYQENAEVYGTTDNYFADAPVLFVAGFEQLGGLNSGQQATLNALPTLAMIDAALMSDGLTYAQSKIVNDAILHGKITGAGAATESFWSVNQAGTLVERVRMTVDASGNRTAVQFIDVNP